MANGGYFGADAIRHFDGGLFADDTVIELSASDVDVLGWAATLDWADVEPAIRCRGAAGWPVRPVPRLGDVTK